MLRHFLRNTPATDTENVVNFAPVQINFLHAQNSLVTLEYIAISRVKYIVIYEKELSGI